MIHNFMCVNFGGQRSPFVSSQRHACRKLQLHRLLSTNLGLDTIMVGFLVSPNSHRHGQFFADAKDTRGLWKGHGLVNIVIPGSYRELWDSDK